MSRLLLLLGLLLVRLRLGLLVGIRRSIELVLLLKSLVELLRLHLSFLLKQLGLVLLRLLLLLGVSLLKVLLLLVLLWVKERIIGLLLAAIEVGA